jgi:hypothetical protein
MYGEVTRLTLVFSEQMASQVGVSGTTDVKSIPSSRMRVTTSG